MLMQAAARRASAREPVPTRKLALLLLAPVVLAVASCGPATEPGVSSAQRGDLSLPELLDALEGEFTPVGETAELAFPGDHAAHPGYRTEAWVLTGLLAAESGRTSALQLTLLRIAVGDRPDLRSDWAAGDVYAGIAMLADGSGDGMRVAERVSRAAAGLAGTSREPLSIWIEDWRLEPSVSADGTLELGGRIEIAGLPIELDLASAVPVVTPADVAEAGAGSSAPFAYYTQPQLEGTAKLGDRDAASAAGAEFVFEHAWGELPLPGSPVARDRFTLFLDDGSQLTLVRTHRADGSGTPETQGLLVGGSGDVQTLAADAVALEPTDFWQSPRTDARYPVEWRLGIPALGIDLRIEPRGRDSEGSAWAPVWMGPVDLISSSSQVSGVGTMMLNGYEASAN